jgi:hypothetical protein
LEQVRGAGGKLNQQFEFGRKQGPLRQRIT